MLVVRCCIAALVLLAVFLIIVDAGYFRRGRHRGEYVEKPEWKPKPEWGRVWVTITPSGGQLNIPALTGPPGPPPSPTWGHNGRLGGFGDLDIDRADTTPFCPFLPDGSLDDKRLRAEGWQYIGYLSE